MRRISIVLFLSLILVWFCQNAVAKVSQKEAERLKGDLTPIGAIRAGNSDGTIPEWTGGLTSPPAGYIKGEVYPDPFADDKILFTITPHNLEQFKDKLSDGMLALFDSYSETYRMNIYPTRRSAAYPQYIYDAVFKNATQSEIDRENFDLKHWINAYPFPIPKDGLEAIYNHLHFFRPSHMRWTYSQAVSIRTGGYNLVRMHDILMQPCSDEGAIPDPKNMYYWSQTVLAPPRQAGMVTLVIGAADRLTHPQRAWRYYPGQRRVRRAPSIAYDGPGMADDGLRTTDDYAVFNGSPDRYSWTLKGKKDIYIPYNSWKGLSRDLKYNDILSTGHLNPEHLRYELHRMWIVEANLKKGFRHLYKKRVFYLDEDTWMAVMADTYDNRDQLWRVVVSHPYPVYETIWTNTGWNVYHDLQSRRYLALFLTNEESGYFDYDSRSTVKDFTPSAISRGAHR